MNRIDKEILTALLSSQQSMYGLEKSLEGTNYATVYRHIKKMQKEGLLKASRTPRKNGKQDERRTQKPELTTKGLATLIIEGDLQEKALLSEARKALKADYSDLPSSFLTETGIDEIFAKTILGIRPKINLQFFDEQYFNQVFNTSLAESVLEQIRKTNLQKDSPAKESAHKLKHKYVNPQQIENFKNLRKLFYHEKTRFDRYVHIIDALLKVLGAEA
jgi:DNA-binding PadR family transcriptional regulator